MLDDSVMEEKLDEDHEAIAVKNGVFAGEQHIGGGLNGNTAIRDGEVSQNITSDFVDKGPMEDDRGINAIEGDSNGAKKKDKADLNGDRQINGVDSRTPQIGMAFKSYEEVVNFYKRYALRVGFGVAVKKSSFTTHGLCRRLVLVCTRGGKGRANECYKSRPTAKTNCPAMVVAKLWGDGLLHLMEANLEHNHAVSPSAARFLKCYKRMSSGMAKDLVVRASRHENLSPDDKEFIIYVEGGRLKLGEGDDEAIHHFFARMQAKSPNFFYLMDMDVEGHLRNVFWADARSRAAYKYFNDVVSFDTSYIKDKYGIPLALFIGVNHHGQSVLLGCGLLSEESIENYVWILKAWLTCMQGCPPHAIITNECKAIQGVNEVFPRVHHRICLWHVMKDIQENLRGFAEYAAIIKALEKLIYGSSKVDEFEEDWKKLINKHALEGNEWFNSLYDIRHLWIPAFLKNTFWAGMSVIHPHECVTAFFDGFIYPNSSIKHFLDKYEMALESKYEMEAKADFESYHTSCLYVSKFHVEEQMCKLYTLNVFRLFQDELKATVYCHVERIKVDGSVSTFNVKECGYMDDGEETEIKDHEVLFNIDGFQAQCDCGLFQFKGILCRHALAVFKINQVYEIPSQYILDRWRKDFKQLHTLARKPKDVTGNNLLERYDNLSMRCLQLVEVGVISDEKYQLALKLIREMEKSLLDENTFRDLKSRLLPFENRANESDEVSQLGIFDGNQTPPVPAKRRGRPPKKLKESNLETVSSSSKNKDQDSLRTSLVGSQSDTLQAASNSPHVGSHIRMHGGVDLMVDVNPNELPFASHFANHQHHVGNQSTMQTGNTIQFSQQPVGSQAQWYYQLLQEDQIPFGRRTG